jgi:mannose-1-phosphate guanylyltransferase
MTQQFPAGTPDCEQRTIQAPSELDRGAGDSEGVFIEPDLAETLSGIDPHFWAVIPAGGSGTRLWPVSRSRCPKFLLSLIGDRRSLLQQTADRLRLVCEPRQTLVVCGPDHAMAVQEQLPELHLNQIVVEPSPRGTCAAIALAAAIIERSDPHAVMGSFAADHAVSDLAAFAAAVRAATDAAADGWLVSLGCLPTRPETGYGYIEVSDRIVHDRERPQAQRVDRFVEKPDLATAEGFLASGNYLWNTGMFVWRVDTFMHALRAYQPVIASGIASIVEATDIERAAEALRCVWPQLPEISVDNGIMERSDRIAVVPVDMGWSDIGDWHGLGALLTHDESGNCTRGDTINVGSSNSVVWSDTTRVISIVGLDNVVVVDTADALLVADRAHVQQVRTTVSRLKETNRIDLC